MQKFCRRNGFTLLLLLVIIGMVSWNMVKMKSKEYIGSKRLFTSQVRTVKGIPIHMIITAMNNRSTLDAIELCSVYSMASSHPNRTIMVHVRKELPDMHLWSSLDNVVIRLIKDSTVCADTPAEKFYSKFIHKLMPRSKFGAVELSDILRVCIVYRLGGTYVDTDVIQLASFNESIEQFVLNQEDGAVNALFHFKNKGNKHLGKILAEMDKSFEFNVWGSIGISQFATEFKRRSSIVKIPAESIIPIDYPDAVEAFLNPKNADSTKATVEAKKSVGLHIFRAMLYWSNITHYSSATYLAKIIKDRCKPIYQHKVVCPMSKDVTIDDTDCNLLFEGKQTE